MKNETARREIESLDYYLQNHTNDYSEESHTAMMMAIDALSSSDNPNKWIPVSERLPEDGTYLVTVERITGRPNVDIDSFAKDLYKVDEFDFCSKKGKCGWYNYDSEYGYWEDTKVIAWMPLPKPYEPQERSE